VIERDAWNRPLRMIGGSQDITVHKRAEQERLAQIVRQRDALVREVHHRIKNHLQGLAGLLRQTAQEHPAVAALLETAVAQMKSVALVYGLQNGIDSAVPLVRILAAICESLEGLTPCRIVRKWDARRPGSLQLAPDEAVPVAVALNELVFNAIKHCERDAGMSMIEMDYSECGEKAEMHITNRGALPVGFDYATGAGCATGLELVKTLLGPKGNTLAIWTRGATVETALTLGAPLVTAQPLQTAA
jgi:two-component sensor histidine kinase